jgi:hypothetical protein
MMKKKLVLGLSVLALAFAPASKVDLGFNLEKGKTYVQHTSVASKIVQTMQGQEMATENKASSKTYMTALGENLYEVWYGDISMSLTAMGQTSSFSSDTSAMETVDPVSGMLAAMQDKKFKAKINKMGEVTEVMGLEEMISEGADGLGAQGAQMKEQIMASFGDGGFAKNLEISTKIFPAESVKSGDSWSVTQETGTGFPLIANITYTLSSVNDGIATINVKGTIENDPDDATMNLQGMDATIFMEGDREGQLQVEVASGWVISGSMKDDIAGSITIAPGAQVPNGMSIPMSITNDITITDKE